MTCFLLTVIILANGYETAFSQDVPMSNSITKINLDQLSPSPSSVNAQYRGMDYDGIYGAPFILKLSNSGVPITLSQALPDGVNWLARSNIGHYMYLGKAYVGNMGTLLVYVRQGRTTINTETLNKLVVGNNLYIETKGEWTYLYKLQTIINISSADEKIAMPTFEKSNHVLIAVFDDQDKLSNLIMAKMVNVQKANQ